MSPPDIAQASPEPGRITGRPRASRQAGWRRWMPGLQTLRSYELAWLRHDLVAGLVLAAMLVPVGIAYAVASGVPAIYGLYATIVPLLAYAVFGPSRILVLGPDSVAGRADPRGRAAAVWRRSDARGRAGRRDGGGLGPGCASCSDSCAWASSPSCCPSRSAMAT
jgi:hypothetical protein